MTSQPLAAPRLRAWLGRPAVAAAFSGVGVRLLVGAAAVLVAFRYSLVTLVRDLGLDTPLAYLGLVPLIAVGIALLVPRERPGPDIHDRQLDHIVGLPLVVACVVAIRVLPDRMSTIYWTDRLDLLTLPFFVFGISLLLFGLRTTWHYKAPIAFLFLAWPLPYTLLIEHAVDFSTSVTIGGLKHALGFVHVAKQVPGGDGSQFTVLAHQPFPVSIASACAGVNSMVGFVVVGAALLTVARGRSRKRLLSPWAVARRKLSWLALGLGLVCVLNVVRLVLVLVVGQRWGEHVAIDGLHPFIGVVVFALAVIVLLLLMPLFGLEVALGAPAVIPDGDTLPQRWARRFSGHPRAGEGWRTAALTAVVAAVAIGVTDATFDRYSLVASDLGAPRLSSYDTAPVAIDGHAPVRIGDYTWVKQYFGGASTWHRYEYAGIGGQPVLADVIDGTHLSAFNAYGIEACYAFHGYTFSHQKAVDLGGGVRGYALSYREPSSAIAWAVTYWVWTVQSPQGRRYERVVLLSPTSGADLSGAAPQSAPFAGVGYQRGSGAQSSGTAEAALTDLARRIVSQAPAAPVLTAGRSGA